jgi:hypothetical protein
LRNSGVPSGEQDHANAGILLIMTRSWSSERFISEDRSDILLNIANSNHQIIRGRTAGHDGCTANDCRRWCVAFVRWEAYSSRGEQQGTSFDNPSAGGTRGGKAARSTPVGAVGSKTTAAGISRTHEERKETLSHLIGMTGNAKELILLAQSSLVFSEFLKIPDRGCSKSTAQITSRHRAQVSWHGWQAD